MLKTSSAAFAVFGLALTLDTTAASAEKWQPAHGEWFSANFRSASIEPVARTRSGRTEPGSKLGGRPSAWCGWYMRTRHGGGPEMNLAWNWSRYGSAAPPQIGAIVVWRHHVGEIVGQAPNGQWIVLSGNDGGQVRSRARSIAGAVVRM
jgi:hypothetical protein